MPATQLATRVFVVTGTEVGETGRADYSFMFAEGVPFDDIAGDSSIYGIMLKRDGRWNVNLYDSSSLLMGGGVDAPGLSRLVESLLTKAPGMVLLMQRAHFDEFAAACRDFGVEPKFVHHNGALVTSGN